MLSEAVFAIKSAGHTVHSVLSQHGAKDAVLCAEAVLIVIDVRHGKVDQAVGNSHQNSGNAEGLLILLSRQIHHLCRGSAAGENLPAGQAPSDVSFEPSRRLDYHGDPLVDFKAGNDRSQKVFAGFPSRLGQCQRRRNKAGRRMTGPTAVFPVNIIGDDTVCKYSTQ